jgi:hypothetical protein
MARRKTSSQSNARGRPFGVMKIPFYIDRYINRLTPPGKPDSLYVSIVTEKG